MTTAKKFHGVRYQVKNVAQSIAFYTQRLGFKAGHQKLPAFANVSLGPLELLLSGPEASGSRPMPDGHRQEPGGWNGVVLRAADLPALVESLKKAGVRSVRAGAIAMLSDHGVQRLPRALSAKVSAAMAPSIAATLIGLGTRPANRPLRVGASLCNGTTLKPPATGTKSTLVPVCRPRACRTNFGTVICPLLVNVAIGMAPSLTVGKELLHRNAAESLG